MTSTYRTLSNQLRFAYGVARRRPFDVCVQLTHRCNMRCGFCHFWTSGTDPSQELTVADYRRISADLARLGSFLVSLEGGEPLMRDDIVDVVEAFARHHLPVIYTNGWYVDAPLAAALFAAGMTQVGVSIDYPDRARHDMSRGLVGAFDRAWSAVETLRRAAPHGGSQVHVMTILMKDNQQDVESLLRMSERRGVDHHLTLLSPRRTRTADDALSLPSPPRSTDLLRLRKRYGHLSTFREYLELIDAFLLGADMPRCVMGQQMFNIGVTGAVTPCNEKLDWIAGNVTEESIASIHRRLSKMSQVGRCGDCWLLCRGFSHVLGSRGSLKGWADLAARMRSR